MLKVESDEGLLVVVISDTAKLMLRRIAAREKRAVSAQAARMLEDVIAKEANKNGHKS